MSLIDIGCLGRGENFEESKQLRVWVVGQCLPSNYEGLGSFPGTAKDGGLEKELREKRVASLCRSIVPCG